MSDGHHKPTYEAPTFGGELERAGMKYDFSVGPVVSSDDQNNGQKKSRRRNKNNRRDRNRPAKEAHMEQMNEKNGIESKTINQAPTSLPDSLAMIAKAIEKQGERFDGMTQSLKGFADAAEAMNENLKLAVEDNSATRQEVKNLNAWTYENLKGDVRRSLVQIGIVGVLSGAVTLFTVAFGKSKPKAHAPAAQAMPPATEPAVTNGAARPARAS